MLDPRAPGTRQRRLPRSRVASSSSSASRAVFVRGAVASASYSCLFAVQVLCEEQLQCLPVQFGQARPSHRNGPAHNRHAQGSCRSSPKRAVVPKPSGVVPLTEPLCPVCPPPPGAASRTKTEQPGRGASSAEPPPRSTQLSGPSCAETWTRSNPSQSSQRPASRSQCPAPPDCLGGQRRWRNARRDGISFFFSSPVQVVPA